MLNASDVGKVMVGPTLNELSMSQKIIDRSHVGDVLQQLYASDLDITISLISKGGYFYLGTDHRRVALQGTTIEEAVSHLAQKVGREFPASDFSRWWVNNFQKDSNKR